MIGLLSDGFILFLFLCDFVKYLVIDEISLQKRRACFSIIETYTLGLLDESKTLKNIAVELGMCKTSAKDWGNDHKIKSTLHSDCFTSVSVLTSL